MIGPLATVSVAALYGWHAGFALAAGLMLLALVVYLAGQRYLPEPPLLRRQREKVSLSPGEKGVSRSADRGHRLGGPVSIAYPMIWSIGIIWVDAEVRLGTGLGTVPAGWFNSLDSFGSILAAAPLVALWAAQARRQAEPTSLTKLAIGSAIMALSILLLAIGSLLPGADGKVSVWWADCRLFGHRSGVHVVLAGDAVDRLRAGPGHRSNRR